MTSIKRPQTPTTRRRSRLSKIVVAAAVLLAIHIRSTSVFNQSLAIRQLKLQSETLWSSLNARTPAQDKAAANTTLVIILGNIRCGEDAWETLYENVLNYNNADLALMVGDTYPEYQNSTLFDRAKYTWRFEEYDDWADAIDLVNGTEWRTTLLPHIGDNGLFGGVKGKKSTGGLLMMVRWFLIQHLKEDKILDKYDKFVITRSDHYYQCPHDLAPLDTDNFVWTSRGESYGGYNDRHLVVGKNDIIPAIDLISPILKNPKSFTQSSITMDDNIERYQARIWHRRGILPRVRQFKRMMFVCATQFDKTRWMERSAYQVPDTKHLPIFLKYPEEYKSATHFCEHPTTEHLVDKAQDQPKLVISKSVLAGKPVKRKNKGKNKKKH